MFGLRLMPTFYPRHYPPVNGDQYRDIARVGVWTFTGAQDHQGYWLTFGFGRWADWVVAEGRLEYLGNKFDVLEPGSVVG